MTPAHPLPPSPDELEIFVRRLFDRVGSFAAIARLTRRQIHDVLFRRMPEDDHQQEPVRDGVTDEGTASPTFAADASTTVEQLEETNPMEAHRYALFVVGKALGCKHEALLAQWEKKYPGIPWEK